MIHNHSLQTSAAFDRLQDSLLGKTDDLLNELRSEEHTSELQSH